jgi:hypothetical protein
MDLNTEDAAMRRAVRQALRRFVVPVMADYTWVNQGTSSGTDDVGGIRLTAQAGSTNQYRGLVRALPTPPYTIEIFAQFSTIFRANHATGVWVRDSATGRAVLMFDWFTANTARSATLLNVTSAPSTGHIFGNFSNTFVPVGVRIADNGTTFTVSLTWNLQNWITVGSPVNRTAYLANPDQIGVYINNNDSVPSYVMDDLLTFRSYRVF